MTYRPQVQRDHGEMRVTFSDSKDGIGVGVLSVGGSVETAGVHVGDRVISIDGQEVPLARAYLRACACLCACLKTPPHP